VIRAARAAATNAVSAEAASAVAAAGGGAVDAVIAGFLAAAGDCPSALLAPAVALVAGFGAGGRVFDGRPAQPGRGAPRPRGFVEEREIPPAAYVAVPRSIPMLVLLSGYRGKASLSELARAGVAAAERNGFKQRARFLRHVAATGVLALRSPDVQTALLAAAGPMAGGTLSMEDLEGATPTESEAEATALAGDTTVIVPPFPETHSGYVECVVACDGRGVLAALSFGLDPNPVLVPELEVGLPSGAVPVRRGVTRVAPGTVLAAAHPIAIATQPGGFAAAIGLADGARPKLSPTDLAWVTEGTPFEVGLAELRARCSARVGVAVLTDGKVARDARSDG
jgi:gamma-glutamyltranspeptidase/glutathione hydrolase